MSHIVVVTGVFQTREHLNEVQEPSHGHEHRHTEVESDAHNEDHLPEYRPACHLLYTSSHGSTRFGGWLFCVTKEPTIVPASAMIYEVRPVSLSELTNRSTTVGSRKSI